MANPTVSSMQVSAPGIIRGIVFYDADANGQQGPGEIGIDGVSINLFRFDASAGGKRQVDQQSTANGGAFEFDSLEIGDYLLEFPPTATLTRAGVTTVTLKPNSPRQVNLSIGAGRILQVRNFGYITTPACIHGVVKVKLTPKCGSAASSDAVFANVPAILIKDSTPVGTAVSGADGTFDFTGLQPGNYALAFPPQFHGHSVSLSGGILPLGFVGPGDVIDLTQNPVFYNGGSGTVQGRVLLQNGRGIAAVPVQLADGSGSASVLLAQTDDSGAYSFANVAAGTYELTAPSALDSGIGISLQNVSGAHQQLTITGDFTVPDIVYSSGVLVDSISSQFQQIGQSTATIASIIPTAMQSAPAYQDPLTINGGGVAFGQIVEASLTRVLGARPTNDPVKILNLLNNSFPAQNVNGETRYTWQARGVMPADTATGPIIGAQVTLYQQAQDIQTQVLRLLDAIEPIILDPDTNDIDAFKQDIVSTLASVVGETGRPGGAVPQRVDVLMSILSDDVDALRDKLGFTAESEFLLDMDVAESEQNQQNFNLLQSYLGAGGILATIWNQYKANISNFSGTQLTRLNWVAEAIPDTVQQIYQAMDSVGFGPSDRRVVTIGPADVMTIEQLLLWIETSASVDWPNRLVAGSARRSEVQAVRREADNQRSAVATLLTNLSSNILVGADRPRAAVEELKRELDQVTSLAGNIAH